MMRKKGPWTVRATALKFRNHWLEVTQDDVIRPDGTAGHFATVRMRPGVSVLALDDDGNVHLTSEYRYAVERDSIEVVSGGIEDGESPPAAARRELREELGIEAADWTDLGTIDPFTSIIHSSARLFLARRLRFFDHAREGTELIKVITVKLEEAVRMVMRSEITHGPSCVLILKAQSYLSK